jgi:hypothetical protein
MSSSSKRGGARKLEPEIYIFLVAIYIYIYMGKPNQESGYDVANNAWHSNRKKIQRQSPIQPDATAFFLVVSNESAFIIDFGSTSPDSCTAHETERLQKRGRQ